MKKYILQKHWDSTNAELQKEQKHNFAGITYHHKKKKNMYIPLQGENHQVI
jgi:hypothetical protein